MKKIYYIVYWDKYMNRKSAFIKAEDQNKAEQKWYKANPQTLIIKIALN